MGCVGLGAVIEVGAGSSLCLEVSAALVTSIALERKTNIFSAFAKLLSMVARSSISNSSSCSNMPVILSVVSLYCTVKACRRASKL